MSEMYNQIETICKERGTNITQMCRELSIPRSVFSELKAGRTRRLSSKYLSQIASYFNVSADYLLGTEKQPVLPKEDGLPEDEFIAFYGEVKDHLDKEDLEDLKTFMRMRAELKKHRREGSE